MTRVARRRSVVALVAALMTVAVVLGACGSSSPDTPAPSGTPREWPVADVVHLAGLSRNPDLTYRLSAHPRCAAASLLLSNAEVQTYKDSGDVIVTNPDRSAGVKLIGQPDSCRRLFAQAFARVR